MILSFRLMVCVVAALALFPLGARADLNGDLYNTDDWFLTNSRAREIASNIPAYQSKEYGGWPKNIDTTGRAAQAHGKRSPADFDNGAGQRAALFGSAV